MEKAHTPLVFTTRGIMTQKKRLKLAKQLLTDTGLVFISIDDSEQAHLKLLCDDIFGEVNFVGTAPETGAGAVLWLSMAFKAVTML